MCKVVAAKPVNEPLVFPNFIGFEEDVVMYTVEIKKVYRSAFVTENTTINVIAYIGESEAERKNPYSWVTPFEIGENYIITGLVQPYKGFPVMVNSSGLSAHIANDGTLTPQSYISSLVLADIKILDEFENSPAAKEYFEHKYEFISRIADDYAATRLDSVSPENGTASVSGGKPVATKSDDEVIKYIKNALIIDTHVKSDAGK